MTLESLLSILQITITFVLLLLAIRRVQKSDHTMAVVFFAFGMACLLLSDLYWLAYGLLRPDTRMPFAANEIGEWALFLLLGACLNADFPAMYALARGKLLCAVLFAAACTALWIGWSGEWVQDILTGIVFGYFLCCLAARAVGTGAFSDRLWRMLGVFCLVLVLAQAATFFASEPLRKPLDLFCYALMFAVMAYLLILAIRALRGSSADDAVCHAFLALAWDITTLYMSAGWFYNASLIVIPCAFVLIYLALGKEADAS